MKNLYRNIALLALAALLSHTSDAQQQAMYTQYMFNGLAINPAYTGSHEAISITALARQQWTQIEGAPNTQTLSVHSPIRFTKASVGGLFMHDKIGVSHQYDAHLFYAYRIPIRQVSRRGETNTSWLSMGLQAGITQNRMALSDLEIVSEENINDPVFTSGDISKLSPNVGFGLFYYTSRSYLGISAPKLIDNSTSNQEYLFMAKQLRHYFITGGYVFDLNQNLKLKPNFLVKGVKGAPVQVDLNANLFIKEVVEVGASYRTGDAFSAIFQLQATEHLRIGYAYDLTTNKDIRHASAGSHEIMVNYRIKLHNKVYLSPRYF